MKWILLIAVMVGQAFAQQHDTTPVANVTVNAAPAVTDNGYFLGAITDQSDFGGNIVDRKVKKFCKNNPDQQWWLVLNGTKIAGQCHEEKKKKK